MKDILIQFKEKGDVALASVFLYPFKDVLRPLLRSFSFVPCPSGKESLSKRGFSHLTLILEAARLRHEDLLRQRGPEQKEAGFVQRRLEREFFLEEGASAEGKKLVLFDDVLTSGTTFRKSLEVLRLGKAKKVLGLVLLDNGDGERLRRQVAP